MVKLGVRDLRISYGGEPILEDVSFDIQEHEIFGIIGPANAGKTSFLKAVNRMDIYRRQNGKFVTRNLFFLFFSKNPPKTPNFCHFQLL